jgi:hypothetical protein
LSPHGGAVERSPPPIQAIRFAQTLQQNAVQDRPDPGGVPLHQPTPAGLAAAAHLGWHIPPLDARPQHKEDARQRHPV